MTAILKLACSRVTACHPGEICSGRSNLPDTMIKHAFRFCHWTIVGISLLAQFVECLDTQIEGAWHESPQWRLIYLLHIHTYIHTHIHTYIHTCMNACMQTHRQTHIHTRFTCNIVSVSLKIVYILHFDDEVILPFHLVKLYLILS